MRVLLTLVIALSSLIVTQAKAQVSCYMNFCVGEEIYNVLRDSRKAKIVGIDVRGKFTIQFLDNGGIGGNWDYSDFAKAYGCTRDGRACVGMKAYNIQRNYRLVSIAGIQVNDLLVLHYADNGALGSGWSVHDLSFTTTPPPPPLCPSGTIWNPRTRRCEPLPPPRCPMNTHWDPVLRRCVADLPNPTSYYTCSISVNGRVFVGRGRDTMSAGDVAINQCLQAGYGSYCGRNAVVCRLN